MESLRKRVGTVFQDYKVFALSVNENVLCRECENEQDRAHVEHALKKSGAFGKISTLEKGADTVLTREFDDKGAGLSGGEQQKVAAARMFAHPFDLAVLDEPSSALDPIAEYKMYESLIDETKNKMVIYISHRLSSAVLSDRIYVFENGTVAEYGSHSELMEQNGVISNVFFLLKIMFKISPGLVIGEILNDILTTIPDKLISVIGIKYVIDQIGKPDGIRNIIIALAIMVGIITIENICNALFFELFAHRARERMYFGIHSKLYEKAISLDLAS